MGENKFAITVKKVQMRFLRTTTGWFKLLTPNAGTLDGDEVEYARRVLRAKVQA